MIRWLRAIFEGRRNRPDAGLDTVADRFGTKPIRPEWRTYDEAKGLAFADVLLEAQRLGYAEADPTTDVGGFDAAHKITILAALAFGCAPNFAAAEIEGVDQVDLEDIKLAQDLGYRIRLVASAIREHGGVAVRVHPALAPFGHPLAETRGALNALFIEGRRIGRIFIQGPGAGAGPTAEIGRAHV